jgi:hypothetical protein
LPLLDPNAPPLPRAFHSYSAKPHLRLPSSSADSGLEAPRVVHRIVLSCESFAVLADARSYPMSWMMKDVRRKRGLDLLGWCAVGSPDWGVI